MGFQSKEIKIRLLSSHYWYKLIANAICKHFFGLYSSLYLHCNVSFIIKINNEKAKAKAVTASPEMFRIIKDRLKSEGIPVEEFILTRLPTACSSEIFYIVRISILTNTLRLPMNIGK